MLKRLSNCAYPFFLTALVLIFSLILPTGATAASQDFPFGKWWVEAKGHKGELHLQPNGGSIFGGAIRDVHYNKQSREITFFREHDGQYYRGRVGGNEIHGTYQQGNQTNNWKAWREDAQKQPSASYGKGFPSGKWWVEAKGHKGELNLQPNGGSIFGGAIRDVHYNKQSGEITFFREHDGQYYRGRVGGNEIHGTYKQGNQTHNWKAWRAN